MTSLRRILLLSIVVAGLAPSLARAVQPDELLPDSKLETRARAISAGLRCLVCQNQSIDDSNAEIARDLRLLVRERLNLGESDEQVRAFLVRRYGNFILLKPPLDLETAFLWGMPAIVLAAGGIVLLFGLRRLQSTPAAPLSQAERDRLARADCGAVSFTGVDSCITPLSRWLAATAGRSYIDLTSVRQDATARKPKSTEAQRCFVPPHGRRMR